MSHDLIAKLQRITYRKLWNSNRMCTRLIFMVYVRSILSGSEVEILSQVTAVLMFHACGKLGPNEKRTRLTNAMNIKWNRLSNLTSSDSGAETLSLVDCSSHGEFSIVKIKGLYLFRILLFVNENQVHTYYVKSMNVKDLHDHVKRSFISALLSLMECLRQAVTARALVHPHIPINKNNAISTSTAFEELICLQFLICGEFLNHKGT
ncbi:hypothetical protein AVEN_264528-1 [Araneus ventricosus]|uniref:Uncharacterized protein n=1 Tax=Araneus ventricosus TaxID=182803 RepID=A0A4Y2G6M8_ARAVE|nr:hypothetical protein AVEN_264528-1 [Araneus ventricosus]